MLGNEDDTFQDIKDANTGVAGMSFVATAETLFSAFNYGIKHTPRELVDKLKGLLE